MVLSKLVQISSSMPSKRICLLDLVEKLATGLF